jgi:uncharacterized protein YecE (DUF72 family)
VGQILVGTSSWQLHRGFYPAGLPPTERIRYYAAHFRLVEVDSTFHQLMPPRNPAAWVERTPGDFVFDVTAFRSLTRHAPPVTGDLTDDFAAFRESIRPLREAGKLGAVLFRFPHRFHLSPWNRAYLAQCRERMPDEPIAVEFRHLSWLAGGEAERTLAFLRGLGIVYVAVDASPTGDASIPPLAAVTEPSLAYVRLHGRADADGRPGEPPRSGYRYRPDEIVDWVARVERLAAEASAVHVLFNTCGASLENARALMDRLGLLPPEPAAPSQLGLPLT